MFLREVLFSPSQLLSQVQLGEVLKPYLGREVGSEDLNALMRDIQALYLAQGVQSAVPLVPPQDLQTGVLKIILVEGTLGQVKFAGGSRANPSWLAQWFDLKAGEVIRPEPLARRLDLFNASSDFQAEGQYVAGQNDAVLDAYPAQELVRFEDRKEPRDWVQTWRAAGGRVFPGGDEGTLNNYRLIAAKDDPIWSAISRFGQPWPPFDFGSGMGLRDVSRLEAEQLGVIAPGQTVAATRRAFNDSLPEA